MGRPIGRWSGAAALACAFAQVSVAASPNPALAARNSGVDDESAVSRDLSISDLDVRVEIVGNVAETTVTAKFVNAGSDDLEGTFTLQMPDDAVVDGYALDVEGAMIDGVLVPPVRAKLAFEQRLRRNVDPGLGEVRRGDIFSTRVYPVLAEKGRTVRISFAAPVPAGRGFSLPLISAQKIAHAAFGVRVRGATSAPSLTWPTMARPEWRAEGADLVAGLTLDDQSLAGDLVIGAAANDGRAYVTRHPSGRRFVDLRELATGDAPPAPPVRSVRVLWDRSTSRRDDDIAREVGLLEKFLTATGASRIDVVTFNSAGADAQSFGDAALALRAVRGLVYRGATSYAVLQKLKAQKADVCLLFSDGIATIDARPELTFDCALQAITSVPDADMGYLGLLAHANRGEVVSLARLSVDDAMRRLTTPVPRVIEARSDAGETLRTAGLEAGPRGWALVAEAPAAGDIVVRLAGVGPGIVERRYTLLESAGPFAGAGALWAHARIDEIAGDGSREAELRELSRRYSVASPAMSFVVLETPDDYIDARIEPPASYPADQLEAYRETKAERDEERTERRAEWLEELVDKWEERKEWWSTSRDERRATRPEAGEGLADKAAPAVAPAIAPAPAPAMGGAPAQVDAMASVDVDEIAVTGVRASNLEPHIGIELAPWKPERPYLEALEAAGEAAYARELEAQESRYGAMPAFYFDVAEWLYRRERRREAVDMLLSALELPAHDTETLAMVAERLQRYGENDRAIWIREEVLRLDPERPQPARSLALALERRGTQADLARSLELLSAIVMTPSDGAYEGIELISLMEANEILAQLGTRGRRMTTLDPRLIAVLDVDLRVVIEWNTAATDLDLWVDEPDGERAIYSNPHTAIGGNLSNDMTSGYGPEEYLLRRAIQGEYVISVNVFANDQINPNGASVVTAQLTRNFGRAGQRTETFEIELKPGDEGEKLVGKFRVGGRNGPSP